MSRTHTAPSSRTDADQSILFNASKDEQFHGQKGYKSLLKRLRLKCGLNKETLELSRLRHYRIFATAGPRRSFSSSEINALRHFIFESGGSVLVMMGEEGAASRANLNAFLEDFGVTVNNDVVVRTQFFKYFHPKECFVSNGVLNRGLLKGGDGGEETAPPGQRLDFVYPYGATLNVKEPSIPVLSSGAVSFPLHRPVAAFYTHPRSGGKVVVLGSPMMFADAYVDKEDNFKIFQLIHKFLTSEEVTLNVIDAEDPDVNDYNFIPDSKALSEQLKVCLQEGEELSPDRIEWFDCKLYCLDFQCLPKVVKAYYQLGVKHKQLALIKPNFAAPIPSLNPAVYPAQFRDVPSPGLELYDLDDQFASEKVRLAQLCNKCADDDLEYFMRECGEILGVKTKVTSAHRNGKHILGHVLGQIIEAKKIN